MLKMKKNETLEGIVTGYTKGTGQYQDHIGSVILETRDHISFRCTPPDRRQPPLIGDIVEIECFELTESGKPRHPRWFRMRPGLSPSSFYK